MWDPGNNILYYEGKVLKNRLENVNTAKWLTCQHRHSSPSKLAVLSLSGKISTRSNKQSK